MKVIGLTGGIGSGKSLVARILKEKYGAYILDSDTIAKQLMEPGKAGYLAVVEYFGKQMLALDGTIDRAKLSRLIFDDKEKRLKINELTHPLVLAAEQEEIRAIREKGTSRYLVVETALMIEAGYHFICDEVWYVFAPETKRRERLKRERNYPDEKIDAIFENQSREEAFRAEFSRVIENTGDIEFLEQQVDRLINDKESQLH